MNDIEKRLQVAEELLRAVYAESSHQDWCEFEKFARYHRTCPPAHPMWKKAPKCNCRLSDLARFFNMSPSWL